MRNYFLNSCQFGNLFFIMYYKVELIFAIFFLYCVVFSQLNLENIISHENTDQN